MFQVVGAAHSDGGTEDVRMPAQRGDGGERAQRGAGGDDLDVIALAVLANRGHDLVVDSGVECVLETGPVPGRMMRRDPDPAGQAVHRVDLDAAGLDERPDGADEMKTLNFLGVAACGGKQ